MNTFDWRGMLSVLSTSSTGCCSDEGQAGGRWRRSRPIPPARGDSYKQEVGGSNPSSPIGPTGIKRPIPAIRRRVLRATVSSLPPDGLSKPPNGCYAQGSRRPQRRGQNVVPIAEDALDPSGCRVADDRQCAGCASSWIKAGRPQLRCGWCDPPWTDAALRSRLRAVLRAAAPSGPASPAGFPLLARD